jgi:DNA-binding NarL/FixJ family response regulator
MPQLTPRQRQILEHLLTGKQNKEIARELKLAVQTVKNEMRDVLGSFGITRTRELFPIVDRVKQELARYHNEGERINDHKRCVATKVATST